MKKKLADSIIGKTIKEIRARSFYLNREIVCDNIVLFLRVESESWYEFYTSDGANSIRKIHEPELTALDDFEDEFAYPVRTLDLNYLDGRIESIQYYIYKNHLDELNGFYFVLDNGLSFSFFEQEECTKICDGIITKDGYSLMQCC